MRYTQDEMRRAYLEIEQNAKPSHALIAGIIGAVPAIAFYAFISLDAYVAIVFLAIPAAIIGLFARFVGRTYRLKHRLPIGAIAALIHVFGCYMIGLHILSYVLTPVAFAIAVTLSSIKLEDIHHMAITQIEAGILKLDSNL